jgi:putative ABC transport system permease protein
VKSLLQDLRYALRVLRKSPGFTAVALLTLALGIGANVAIFSVVRGVLLRPLPYHEPERLVAVFTSNPERPGERGPFSPQDLDDFRSQQQTYSSVGAYWYSEASSGKTLAGHGEPRHLESAFADSSFFTTLGVAPALGRAFAAAEDVHGNDAVAILSDGLWRRLFQADPGVVGQTVTLDGSPFVVVGVMPPAFAFPARQVDLWLPLAQITDDQIPHMRQLRWIDVVARLKPGVSAAQAQSASTLIMARLAQRYPDTNSGAGAAAVFGLRRTIVGDVRPLLLLLLAAVALVLLMACANLANLLLARGAARQREFAIRSALGAPRWRLAVQSLTESLVLGTAGGAASFLFASWITTALVALGAGSIPRPDEIRIDGAVVLFGAVLSLLTGVLVGAVPALKLQRVRLWEPLKGAGSSTADVVRQRGRDALVVAEVALACLLLAGTSLTLKSLWNLLSVAPGFDASHVLAVQLPIPLYKYSSAEKQSEYRSELLRRVAALPRVVAVGGSKTLPLYGGGEPYGFKITTRSGATLEVTPSAGTYIVTQGYFEALSIPVVAGRAFDEADLAGRRKVAVISRRLAATYWPDQDAVGQQLDFGRGKLEVIGVVGDVRNQGLSQASGTALYVPSSLFPRSKLDLFVRTRGEPLERASAVRRAIQELEPDQAIASMAPLQRAVSATLAQPRFFSLVLSAFGAVALLLSAIGVFGVLSYSVRQRTREIGIRMALGATRRDVLLLVLRQALVLLSIGAAVGVAGALGSGRLLAGVLYGVGPADPLALSAAVIVLGAVALAAAMLPARRATRVDPVVALRYE